MARKDKPVTEPTQQPAATPPAWALDMVQALPQKRFDVEMHGRNLHVFAKQHREFGFDLLLTTNRASDEANLRRLVDYYNAPDLENATLDHYLQQLEDLKQLGFTREPRGESAEFTSVLHNPKGEGIGTIISGTTPEKLFDFINEDAIGPAEDAIIAQLEFIERLEADCGIKNKVMKSTQMLRLEHPRLKQGEAPARMEIPMQLYGKKDYWLDKESWQQLEGAIERVTQRRVTAPAAAAIDLPIEEPAKQPAPPPPSVRLKESAIAAPKADETLLLMDNAALVECCTSRTRSESDWTDLLHETLKLPSVGKIIIPDYILDFEMLGVARRYDADDNPDEIVTEGRPGFFENRQRMREFIHNAVRRHVDSDGKVSYLLEPGVKAKDANPNIIIWETRKGQEMEEKIYQLAKNEEFDAIHETYRKKGRRAAGHIPTNDLDNGEQVIEELTNGREEERWVRDKHTLGWKNPVFIISSDHKYLKRKDNKKRTAEGGQKAYVSTYAYIMSELEARGEELKQKLQLQHDVSPESLPATMAAIYRQIYSELRKQTIVTQEIDTASIDTSPAADDDITIAALIGNGLRIRNERGIHKPPPVIQPVKKQAATRRKAQPQHEEEDLAYISPTQATMDLGAVIAKDMVLRKLDAEKLAKLVGPVTPHMPPTTPKMIQRIMDGSLELDHDHLYALLVLLVDNNDKIAPDDKHAKAREMIDAYMAVVKEQAKGTGQPVDQDASRQFGRFVGDRMMESGNTDWKEFADVVREQRLRHLRPSEEKIDEAVILEVVEGNRVPSAGLALAIRRAMEKKKLLQPEEGNLFDIAYFNSKRDPETVAPPITLQEAKSNVLRHFTEGERQMKPSEVKDIINANDDALISDQKAWALLGNSSTLRGKKLLPHELENIGNKLVEWVETHAPDSQEAGRRVADFRIDYETLMLTLEKAELKARE